jgi:hypothetical protein
MQKQILHGVPYYTDKQNLYIWDPESVAIGTYQGETITFQPDLLTTLGPRLAAWRAEQQSRVRKPTATSRRTRASKTTAAESVEDDE